MMKTAVIVAVLVISAIGITNLVFADEHICKEDTICVTTGDFLIYEITDTADTKYSFNEIIDENKIKYTISGFDSGNPVNEAQFILDITNGDTFEIDSPDEKYSSLIFVSSTPMKADSAVCKNTMTQEKQNERDVFVCEGNEERVESRIVFDKITGILLDMTIKTESSEINTKLIGTNIFDFDYVPISPPNPTLEDNVGPTNDEPLPPPVLPPKKQVSQGTEPTTVICKTELVLILKNNGEPACVKENTAVILEDRGWGVISSPSPEDTVSTHTIVPLSIEYTKEGGIAGIRNAINVDSSNSMINIEDRNGTIQSQLADSDITELFDFIIDSGFFSIEYEDFPPQSGWADFFSYNLIVTTESGIFQINWTDASEFVPESAISIASGIEILANKIQCEDSGDSWGIWGNAVPINSSCNPATTDGGVECTDSSQCQSFCQAKESAEIGSEDTGMCYEFELAICMQEVRNGIVENMWCQ